MTTAVQRVATRSSMAALSPRSADDTVYLVEPGREGIFVWETANRSTEVTSDPRQGVYVPPSSDATGASGAWVRRFEDSVNAEWFGITGDGSTDNSDGMDGLLSFLLAGKGGHGTSDSPPLYRVMFGLGKYHFSRTIHLKIPVVFEGISPVGSMSPATQFDFTTGGFVCHRHNTKKGSTGPYWAVHDSPGTTGADGSVFRNLYCTSRQARPAELDYSAEATDGLLSFCAIQVDNCFFDGFTRDGLSIQTSNVTGTGVDGSANMSHLEGVHALYNGRHGIHLEGVDSNQITCRRCNVRYNNNWGLYDSGFLSNQHYDHHAAYNGLDAARVWPGRSKGDRATSVVRYPATGGTDYYVNPGKAALALQYAPGTAPSGVDPNTIWVKQMEGAGTLGHDAEGAIKEWGYSTETHPFSTKEGGSYYIDSITPSVAVNLYCELSQGQPYAGSLNVCYLAGNLEGNPNSIGTFVMPSEGALSVRFGKAFQARYANPSNGKARYASLGYGLSSGAFLQFFDEDKFPGHGFTCQLMGGDLSFGTNHESPHFVLTGPQTTRQYPASQFEPNVLQVPRLVVGSGGSGRIQSSDSGEPQSGFHNRGEIVWNNAPSAGGKIGWVCVSQGTPGTWKGFGAIDA